MECFVYVHRPSYWSESKLSCLLSRSEYMVTSLFYNIYLSQKNAAYTSETGHRCHSDNYSVQKKTGSSPFLSILIRSDFDRACIIPLVDHLEYLGNYWIDRLGVEGNYHPTVSRAKPAQSQAGLSWKYNVSWGERCMSCGTGQKLQASFICVVSVRRNGLPRL